MAGYTGTAGSLMAFVWSAADGYRQLTLPAEGQGISTAWGVSADGNTVVGRIATPSGSQAYRWSDDTGVVPLGILTGHTESVAFAASADGRIVVGNSSIGDVDLAVIWDKVNGLRSLKDVLELDFGLDLSGWVLTSANSVSYDGSVIVGSGINPDVIRESWIVTSIPLPAGVVLFVSALGILGLLRRGQA